MSLRLWHRLFLAFASVSVVALAVFATLQGRSVQQGFLGYINRLERERVEAATARLSDAYDRHRGWDFLRGDTPRLLRLLSLDTPFGEPPARPTRIIHAYILADNPPPYQPAPVNVPALPAGETKAVLPQ